MATSASADKNRLAARVVEFEKRCEELERLNKELQFELDELRDEREANVQAARSAAALGARVLVGNELRQSFKAWLEAKSLRDPLPGDETADVLAAVVRRVVRVKWTGMIIAFVVGAIPASFLFWQNLLIQDQIEQQDRDSVLVRRAELLNTIYEETCEPNNRREGQRAPGANSCRPKAHPRARREAVLALLGFERNRGVKPDLTGADLRGLDLRLADLRGVIITDVDLSGAKLRGADLRTVDGNYPSDMEEAQEIAAGLGAIFGAYAIVGTVSSSGELFDHSAVIEPNRDSHRATSPGMSALDETVGAAFKDLAMSLQSDVGRGRATSAVIAMGLGSLPDLGGSKFTNAQLIEADLREASLAGSDFSRAILVGADLSGADLSLTDFSESVLFAANLDNTNLSLATGLSKGQIDLAFGNLETALPEHLEMPVHWSLSKEEQRKHLLLEVPALDPVE